MKLSWAPLLALLVLGCGGEKVSTVTRKPVAAFKATQSTVRPQLFTLDASESFATVGELSEYVWTFGDEGGGPPTVSSSPTGLKAYTAPGQYVITLIVKDDKNTESEPVTQTVTVGQISNEAPIARIAGPSSGAPGATLTFDGSASTPLGDLQLYSWNFGDAASGDNTLSGPAQSTATHTFSSAGNFRITLTVTDSLGQSDTAELLVAIGESGPLAVCTWSPQPAIEGVSLTFDGSQSTAPNGSSLQLYVWDFGDGSPAATGATVQKTYNVQATFKPKLKVVDDKSRIHETFCTDVVVGPAPMCSGDYTLTANPAQVPGGLCGTVSWAGNRVTLTQSPDGGMLATENAPPGGALTAPDGGSVLSYEGSWTGSSFNLTGSYVEHGMSGDLDTEVTIDGQLAGCASFSGTWRETKSVSGYNLCTYTFNISGSRL